MRLVLPEEEALEEEAPEEEAAEEEAPEEEEAEEEEAVSLEIRFWYFWNFCFSRAHLRQSMVYPWLDIGPLLQLCVAGVSHRTHIWFLHNFCTCLFWFFLLTEIPAIHKTCEATVNCATLASTSLIEQSRATLTFFSRPTALD